MPSSYLQCAFPFLKLINSFIWSNYWDACYQQDIAKTKKSAGVKFMEINLLTKHQYVMKCYKAISKCKTGDILYIKINKSKNMYNDHG